MKPWDVLSLDLTHSRETTLTHLDRLGLAIVDAGYAWTEEMRDTWEKASAETLALKWQLDCLHSALQDCVAREYAVREKYETLKSGVSDGEKQG